MSGKKEDFERELKWFKFCGPGVYITKTDTLIIVPDLNEEDYAKIWNQVQPEDMMFTGYIYNCPSSHLIFNHMPWGSIPVRQDER